MRRDDEMRWAVVVAIWAVCFVLGMVARAVMKGAVT